MAGPRAIAVLLALLLLCADDGHGIQNDKTWLQASKDDITVSESLSWRARTFEDLNAASVSQGDLQQTERQLRLESSRSQPADDELERLEAEETRQPSQSLSTEDAAIEPSDVDEVLVSSKLIDHIDGNQIEVKTNDYYRNIVPTRSESMSGEARGAPQGQRPVKEAAGPSSEPRQHPYQQLHQVARQGRREPARIFSEHAPPPPAPSAPASATSGPRQANPDIQDIITGIVKLLHGKVNVAVNSAQPLPTVQNTRINNRGPPRISDMPPLPLDFDMPGMNPPPPPPEQPSTYETPPAPSMPSTSQLPPKLHLPTPPFNGIIPIPDSIIPHLPSRPHWTWPIKSGGTRRPVTVYKPLVSLNNANTTTAERDPTDQHESNAVLDETNNRTRPEVKPSTTTSTTTSTPVTPTPDYGNHPHLIPRPFSPSRKYHSTLKTDSHSPGKNTLVLGGAPPQPQPIPSDNRFDDLEPKPVVPLKTDSLQEKLKSSTVKTLGIETSSSVQVIETTPTSTRLEPSSKPSLHGGSQHHHGHEESASAATSSISPVSLEPSRSTTPVNLDPSSSSSTPTDGLTTSPTVRPTTSLSHLNHKPGGQQLTNSFTFTKGQGPLESYFRPGIVLDDTLDLPGSRSTITQSYTSPETFDVIVSAIQGPGQSGTGAVNVPVNGHNGAQFDILTSPVAGNDQVHIDGKRTHFKPFDNSDGVISPSKVYDRPTKMPNPFGTGTGFVVPQEPGPVSGGGGGSTGSGGVAGAYRPIGSRPWSSYAPRTTQPTVRIETCIVGDSSTCESNPHETCTTVQGVSACHCKPGYARLIYTLPCKRIVSIVVSIRVDKFHVQKMAWNKDLADKDSHNYQSLSYEANRAIESAMSMTPFFDEYVGSFVNNVYQGDVSQGQGGVFVNATLKLAYEPRTARQTLAGELQKHLLGVIQRRQGNIGSSALYVDSPAGSISNLQDLDECASAELNDCHSGATCANNWGGFTCTCKPGFKDPHKGDVSIAGRLCLTCPNSHCNNRGTCSYQGDQMQCTCMGNYYGAQCEIDGEVLGVAIGASVAALIVIVLTLVCLIMWSRKWSREQKALSPVYGYVQGTLPGTLPANLARIGSVGTLASVKQGPPTNLPPYMWAQVADHLATANVYATEPMGPTRPSSAMFAYPTLSLHGTMPPVPLPRLQAPPPRARQRPQPQPDPDSSDSEPQDKDRADLIPQSNFHSAPRPKSRSSMANQSGIYYDVEYDQGDARHLSKNNIPMSTYSMAPYYRT